MPDLLQQARSLARGPVAAQAQQAEHLGRLDPALVDLLAQEGWLGLHAPKRWGGQEVEALTLGQVLAELGQACTSARSLITVQAMVIEALLRWGTQAQKERWLPGLASGQERAAFAMSEAQAGSDTSGLQTTATPHSGAWRLEGEKTWISFGASATILLVFARVSQDALGAFLVPASTAGLERAPLPPMLGARGSQLSHVALKGCLLPPESKLRGGALPGLGAVGHTALHLGRLCVAWGCVGMIERALGLSLEHARGRLLQGRPLAQAPLAQQLLAQMVVDARCARALCTQAAHSHQARSPEAVGDTLVAKLHASQAANRVLGQAAQLHGARGCQQGHPIERLYRDARLMEIIEGPTQVLEPLVAQASLGAGTW